MDPIKPLPVEKLCALCTPSRFEFQTTEELPVLQGMLGQTRALEAIRFSIGIDNSGYNLYAMGPSGIGKRTAVEDYLHEHSAQQPTSDDWCYVNNFADPSKPNLIRIPAGQGRKLRDDLQQLLKELRVAVPNTFDSDEYKSELRETEEEFDRRERDAFKTLGEKAEERQVKLIRRPGEFTFAPLRDGKAIDVEEFQQLSKEDQERIEHAVSELQADLGKLLGTQIPQWRKERRDCIRKLNSRYTREAVGHLIDALLSEYAEFPKVTDYLHAVEEDVIDNVAEFQRGEVEEKNLQQLLEGFFKRYQVNLLIDRADESGVPVVYEDNPTYAALVGRIEHEAQMGALLTDFTHIKPGALQKANGGYLLLDVRKVLLQPFAWDGLKRAISSKELRVESLGQALSLVSTVSLEPEPMPLDVKVVLLGDRLLYYLLHEYDPDFSELFKVAADFEDDIERSDDNQQRYAQLIATLIRKEGLNHFDASAVAAIVNHSSRLISDQKKLSTHIRAIADLIQEANYWGSERGGSLLVSAADIKRAIDAQVERADRVRDRWYESIQRNTIRIRTEGVEVGQVNGLSVIDLGNFAFGAPSRISANTRLGEGEVLDIEREVELGGPLHSKGVFILSSFLGARYSPKIPLSMSATIAFEQSYGGVEGDSASTAELCALLSSLAELPLRQDLAVTGSVDQHGNVQAIGGVNQKIEGFFDVCKQRGLTGSQGVLIPEANVQHLMLREDVIAACRDGQFNVYPIATVDQAMHLLAGVEAGASGDDGLYPPESVNGRVQRRLGEFAAIRHAFAAAKSSDSDETHPIIIP